MTAVPAARRPAGRVLLAALLAVVAVATGVGRTDATAQITPGDPSPGATTSSTPTPTSASGVTAAAAALPGQLDAVVARADDLVGAATVSIVVTDDQGDIVWSAGPDRPLLPASAMKVLTAASVLDELGVDGIVPTGVAAMAPVGAKGVVDGDVVVVGNGDPTLTTDAYRRWIHPTRPSTAVGDLADVIVAAGVRRITGDLVGDGTRFGPASTAAGWPSRYFADFDAHHITPLTVDTGRKVVIDQSGDTPQVFIEQHEDPARRTTRMLARALADRGVVIEGRARRSRGPRGGTHPLGRVTSPPMGEVVAFMLHESDNHLADTLVRTAALRDSGDGSWAAADRRVRAALDGLGVDTTGLVVADGSGLSRANRVSARQLVATDVGLTEALGSTWSSMLAVAGESGTLENRLLGTEAQGRVFAKTGTLADVRALVGHVVGEDDARYHFAMMVNDVDEGIRYLASVLGDEISLVLADALDGCQRVREVAVAGPRAGRGGGAADGTGPSGPSPPTPSPSPRMVLEMPSVHDPGPALTDSAWRRRCPGG